jgi:hypothetical protein
MCRIGLIRSLHNEEEIKNFMKHCWKECLNRLKENKENIKLLDYMLEYNRLKEFEKKDKLPDYMLESNSYFHITTKYAFGVLDGYICKIKLEEEISKMNFSLENFDKIIKDYKDNDLKINKETYEKHKRLKIHLVDPIDTIRELFQEVKSDYTREDTELESAQNSIKWKILIERISYSSLHEIKLQVFKKTNDNNNWEFICGKSENYEFYNFYLCGIKQFNDNHDIIILTTQALLIYNFNENINTISLNYCFYMDLNPIEKRINKLLGYEKVFSISTLPLPNFNNHLMDSLEKDEECFLKYGVELLLSAIKKYDKYYTDDEINDICNICINYDNKEMLLKYVVELCSFTIKCKKYKDKDEKIASLISLICNIYKRCIDYDHKEVLLRYGVELLTFVVEERKLELIDKIYKKCINYFKEDPGNNSIFLSIIVSVMPLLNNYYPEYILRYSLETTMIVDFSTYSVKHRNNNLHLCSLLHCPRIVYFPKFTLLLRNYLFKSKKSLITRRTIIFMNPYIKFVNYPKDYNWFSDFLVPQPSLFVKMMSKDIYKTWDGEALINFKWHTFGKYYHYVFWIGYIALVGCLNMAASIPQHEYVNIRKKLLITSIILGFIYLNFEVRQFIFYYHSIEWTRNIGNLLGM